MNEEQTEELVTASLFERVVAFVIDLALFNFLLIVLGHILIRLGLINNQNTLSILVSVFYFVFFVYLVLFTAKGKTFGKMLVGIEVVNKDGKSNLTLKQSLFRVLGYILNFITLSGGFLLGFFNQQNRTLPDFLASSIVISTRKKSSSEEIAFSILGTITICAFILLAYYIFFKAPSPFDQKKLALAKTQLENLAYLEELHKENFGYYTEDLRRLSLISGDGVQLNRDLQNAFRRLGFKIGLSADKRSYRIEGYAKDSKETLVFKEK
jgi:Predicted membrane protein/domain